MEKGLEVKELRAAILRQLTFTAQPWGELLRYSNRARPELGELIFCEREGLYAFASADYTIARDFTLPFDHRQRLLRFGVFHQGKTETKMSGALRVNTASAFLCVERGIHGVQTWRRGQHFHGTEVLLYPAFFDRFIEPLWPGAIQMECFRENEVYPFLPEEMLPLLEHMSLLSHTGRLSRVQLEALLIASVAALIQTLQAGAENPFSRRQESCSIPLGANRTLRLTNADMAAIRAAHEILTLEASEPPSLAELSRRVSLGEQKLKLGFAHVYHQTVSEYVNNARMSRAAGLLTTTDLSIEEIARSSGFQYSGNFSRKFRERYGVTPMMFRKRKELER